MSVRQGRRGRVRLLHNTSRARGWEKGAYSGPRPRVGPRLAGTNLRAKLTSPRIKAGTMVAAGWLRSYGVTDAGMGIIARKNARRWFRVQTERQRLEDAAYSACNGGAERPNDPITAAEREAGRNGLAAARAALADEPP